MPTFGMLEGVSEARIRDVLSQMATDGFLFISEGRLPIVKFGTRAAETVAPGFHYEIKKIERTSPTKRGGAAHGTSYEAGDEISSTAVGSYIPDDDAEASFQRLRELRLDIAREIGKPPYIVFSDRTLRDMARMRPVTNAQFLAVNGVGDNKLRLYGERFMNLIRSINAG